MLVPPTTLRMRGLTQHEARSFIFIYEYGPEQIPVVDVDEVIEGHAFVAAAIKLEVPLIRVRQINDGSSD